MTRLSFVLGAGALLALVLGALMLGGLLLERWSLVAVAGWVLASVILLVQLDVWRRVRSLRRYVRDQVRQAGVPTPADVPAAPAASPEDVVGAVRLLQAQYVGRLDRMQTALEDALAAVRARDDSASRAG